MCTQCVSVSDERPAQQTTLTESKLMQRALRNILLRKVDNELITTLFENITTLAQLHQFTRAEGTTEDRSHNQKKRHITQWATVSRFQQRYIPLPILLTCSLVTSPLLTNAGHVFLTMSSVWTSPGDGERSQPQHQGEKPFRELCQEGRHQAQATLPQEEFS